MVQFYIEKKFIMGTAYALKEELKIIAEEKYNERVLPLF